MASAARKLAAASALLIGCRGGCEEKVDQDRAGEIAATLWAGRSVEAGHRAARVRFKIPAGLAPLQGVSNPNPAMLYEFSDQSPAGVGVADGADRAMNSIVVYSDPEGLGVTIATRAEAASAPQVSGYLAMVRKRFEGASEGEVVEVGGRPALRIDLPHVPLPNRPVRHGRHYLLFDQAATISVDCLWLTAEATRMSAACDEVAAGLTRVTTR
ncbi:MAG: hypothetical protein KA297_27660 [Kofleriaceae bacterium]|nr:hypothetical protein [Kofleriaceae bacterium]MBP6836381.1 hypothetical protein [Kofleriaceae bacterium]